MKVLALRLAASERALVTRVRTKVRISRRQRVRVVNRVRGSGSRVALTALTSGPGSLEGSDVAGGHDLPDVFLDAPGDGELEVGVEDLLEPGSLAGGEPVPGAGEELAVPPRRVGLPPAALVGLPGAAAPDGGDTRW